MWGRALKSAIKGHIPIDTILKRLPTLGRHICDTPRKRKRATCFYPASIL